MHRRTGLQNQRVQHSSDQWSSLWLHLMLLLSCQCFTSNIRTLVIFFLIVISKKRNFLSKQSMVVVSGTHRFSDYAIVVLLFWFNKFFKKVISLNKNALKNFNLNKVQCLISYEAHIDSNHKIQILFRCEIWQ
jgi:hypothetical protein